MGEKNENKPVSQTWSKSSNIKVPTPKKIKVQGQTTQ